MSLTFMVIADPQFGIFAFQAKKAALEANEAGTDLPTGELFTHWEREERLFGAAIDEANRIKPDFVVICGDMVMEWNSAEQIESVKRVAADLDSSIPLHWVPGNHDVGVDYFAPSPESLESYRSAFGDDYYAFTHGDTRFIAINTPLIDRPESVKDEYERQIKWLTDELSAKAHPGVKHRIVFSHHPPFLTQPDEEDEVYNLPLERRAPLLKSFRDGGVEAVFAGHTHMDNIARHEGLEVVASASCGYNRPDQLPGYRIVTVSDSGIEHTFHRIEDE